MYCFINLTNNIQMINVSTDKLKRFRHEIDIIVHVCQRRLIFKTVFSNFTKTVDSKKMLS